jgi:hypothetical protein
MICDRLELLEDALVDTRKRSRLNSQVSKEELEALSDIMSHQCEHEDCPGTL